MAMRKRTSDVRLRKREKFGRKEALGCVVVNGSFETGDLTGWVPQGWVGVYGGGPVGSYYCSMGSEPPPVNESNISQVINQKCNGQTLHLQYRSMFQWNPGTVLLTLCADGAPCQDFSLLPVQMSWLVYEVVWPDALVDTTSKIMLRTIGGASPSLQMAEVDDIRFL